MITWQVLIYEMNQQRNCGGSIINRLFILSAAHCHIECDDLFNDEMVRTCKKARNIPQHETERDYWKKKNGYIYPSNLLGIIKIELFRNLRL